MIWHCGAGGHSIPTQQMLELNVIHTRRMAVIVNPEVSENLEYLPIKVLMTRFGIVEDGVEVDL